LPAVQAGCEAKSARRHAVVIEKEQGNDSAHVPDLPGCAAGLPVPPSRRDRIFLRNVYRYVDGTKMTATATLSSKFQISIPKAVRDEQHWQAGQEFVFIPKGKGVLVMPVPELDELAGIAKGARREGCRDREDRY
jgi:AbrB family looped-hinge helix DNA binding protein